ncbi:MAG: GAF domain-containing protein [Anaerolineae bacterium]|jgi:signal transduction histidine kinase|nr:GAF domain-containing protein [Anaerolineae bacterium]
MSATSTFQTLLARSNREKLLWRSLSAVVAAVTLLAYGVYLVNGLQYSRQPFPGFMLTYTNTINGGLPANSSGTWAGLAAGLVRHDWIIGINEVDLRGAAGDYAALRTNYHATLRQLAAGDSISITFQRDTARVPAPAGADCTPLTDGFVECRLPVRLEALSTGDFLAFFLLPYVAGIFVIFAGLLILWLRSDTLEGFLALTMAFTGAIFIGGLFDVASSHVLIPLWIIAATVLGGVMMSLGMAFPMPSRLANRWPLSLLLPFVPGAVIALAGLRSYVTPLSPLDNQATQTGTIMCIAGVVVLLLLQFFSQRPRAMTAATRDQTFAILIGTGILLIPALLWLAGRFLMPLPIPLEALMPLFVFPTAAVAYAVLQYRRLDTDVILSQSITHFIMALTLIVSIFLVTLGGTLLTRTFLDVSDPLWISVILFAMVLLFSPFRNWLQERIDSIYYRARRNYQAQVEAFGQKLTSISEYPRIIEEFRQTLEQNLAPAAIFIFVGQRDSDDYTELGQQSDLRFSAGSPVIKLLSGSDQAISLQTGQIWPQVLWSERARLMILRAAILAPLPGTGRLNGFVILGPSRSGRPYQYDELRFINNLVGQFAISTERAQVITSLDRRVKELEVLSQVGNAVNFTIEFDDLLELISAQTARLIDARCFYITLYEESIQQMRFAFFLEDDERYNDNENRRWALDDGLFSEVVRTGKALRVTNYALEMKIRSATRHFESDGLRAWMGVPLTAPRRIMGVIAVGKLNTDENYTDEQFKIFSDIGSLAATSIDKAALFTETRIRERQLTALNDITRQLVATESNVEKLLGLIMSSAVEILSAEAGSLLLTSDDGSNELEFRVVIGGSGSELIGRRLKISEGIVGQVATSGKPYISNDAVSDPKHRNVISTGKFQTSNLLAVPLIAKERVIGVLEVLNKVDGTPFIQADSDLLTTFAGQAAVAIENARLLQMTDLQLGQRVQELELLERIDSELNRTLELGAVASITVRSALNALKASAGALGIVNQAERTLEIIALEGYTDQEYPPDANGRVWPLDKGIVRRVMRTRRADLATDISIDPDYKGGLTGSLSQITLPMFSGSDINAILILEKKELPRFTLPDWAFAQRIAEHASIAIANAQLYDALTSANRSKSEFMGFAAHELKNPLTPIKAYTAGIQQGMLGPLSPEMSGVVSIIYSNVIRMERIIRDLQDAAKLEAGQFKLEDVKPTSLYEVIQASVQPFDRQLEDKDLTFVNEIPEDLPAALGDEGRLVQVFTNLISNSYKYTDPEKTIRVTGEFIADYRNRDGKRLGAMVKISVIDQGYGMKPEDLARLGKESYFRSTNEEAKKKEGTGLGMRLTFGIVESHGGDVAVESEYGTGTSFHIFLPVAPDAVATLPSRPRLAAEPASD